MLTIRRAEFADLQTVVGFLTGLAEATHLPMAGATAVEEGVRAILTRPELKSWYWLAEFASRPVGMMRVEVLWDDLKAADIWYLQRMYVEPGHRRTGVATALQHHALAEALRSGNVARLSCWILSSNHPSQSLKARLDWFENVGFTYFAELNGARSNPTPEAPSESINGAK
jgi:GNAT superfamily N-acetyltransferase